MALSGIELTPAYIPILASGRDLAPSIAKAIQGATGDMQSGGKTLGKALGGATVTAAEEELGKLRAVMDRSRRVSLETAAAAEKARKREADVIGQLRVAETRLAEVRSAANAKASQIAAAEERLAKAQREVAAATRAAASAVEKEKQAATEAAKAADAHAKALDKTAKNATEAATKTTALGRALAGVKSNSGIQGAQNNLAAVDKSAGGASMAVGRLGAVLGGVSVGAGLKAAIDQASDLNEAGTKMNEIFGAEGTKAVEAFASKGAAALGQSKLAVIDAAGTFGIFAKAGNLAGVEAAKFSTQMVQLSTDLASFHNTSPEDAVVALGAALRGESEPIRRYGVLIDEASIKAQAMSSGLIKATTNQDKISAAQLRSEIAQRRLNEAVKKHGEESKEALSAQSAVKSAQAALAKATEGTIAPLTQQQKVMAVQQLIMKQTAVAHNDFARTSSGMANQSRITAATLEDMKGKLGEQLLPAALSTVTALNTKVIPALQSFGGWVQNNKGTVLAFAGAIGVMALAMKVQAVAGAQAAGTTLASYLSNLVKGNIIVQAFTATQWLFTTAIRAGSAALLANPIGLTVLALTGLGAALYVAWQKSDTFRAVVTNAWNSIKTAAITAWDGYIKPALMGIVSWVTTQVIPAAQRLWGTVGPVFTWIGQAASTLFTNYLKVVFNGWLLAYKGVEAASRFLWDNVIRPVFSGIGGFIAGVWNNIVKPVFTIFGDYLGRYVVPRVSEAVSVIGRVWNNLKALAAAPIRFVIEDVINKGIIGGYNSVVTKFGGAALDPIPLPGFLSDAGGPAGTKMPGKYGGAFASGGWVPGRSPHDRADNILAKLTAKEFVLPVRASKALHSVYGDAGMESLRQGRLPVGSDENPGPRAGGPRTTPISGAGPGDSGIWRQMAAWVKSHIPGAIVTSAYRNTYTATGNVSNHARGMALDLAGGPGMMKIFQILRSSFPNSLELIHTPAGSAQLRNGRPFVYSGVTAANHYDHVHWAMSSMDPNAPASPGGGFFGNLLAPVKAVVNGLLGKIPGSDTAVGKIIKGVPIKVLDAASDYADRLFGGMFGGGTSSDNATMPSGGGVARWEPTVREALARVGLPVTPAYIGAWMRQIASESSGNPNAVQGNIGDINNKTGDLAKGLVQVIGSTFAAYRDPSLPNDRFNPLANLVAGMRYAKARYRNMLSVIGHGHGYNAGGTVKGPGGVDKVLAWLTAREFVLPVNATEKLTTQYGSAGLEALRQGRLPAFADGGLVGKTFGLTGAKANTMDVLLGKYSDNQLSPEAQKIADSVTRFKEAMASTIKPVDELTQKVKDAQTKLADLVKANADAAKKAQAALVTAKGKTGVAQRALAGEQRDLVLAQRNLVAVQRNRRSTPAQVAATQRRVEAARRSVENARRRVDAARDGEAKARTGAAAKSAAAAQLALKKAQDEVKANQARTIAQTKINAILDSAAPKLQALTDEASATQKSLDAAKQTLDDAKKALADYSQGLQQATMGKFGIVGIFEELKNKRASGNAEMDAIAAAMIKGDFSGGDRYKALLAQQTGGVNGAGGAGMVAGIADALRGGIEKVKSFTNTVNALNVAGLDKGLIKQLADGGIDAAPLAEAIKAAGPGAIAELSSLNSKMQLESKLSADAFAEIVHGQQVTIAQKSVDAWTSAMDSINAKMVEMAESISASINAALGAAGASGGGGASTGGVGTSITGGVSAQPKPSTTKTAAQIVAEIAARRAAETAAMKAGTARVVSGSTMAARTAADLKAAGLPPTTVVNFNGQVGASPKAVTTAVANAQTKASIIAGRR